MQLIIRNETIMILKGPAEALFPKLDGNCSLSGGKPLTFSLGSLFFYFLKIWARTTPMSKDIRNKYRVHLEKKNGKPPF